MKYYVVYYLTDQYDENKDVVYVKTRPSGAKTVELVFEHDKDMEVRVEENIILFETQEAAEEFAAECRRIDGIDEDDESEYVGIYGVEEIEV